MEQQIKTKIDVIVNNFTKLKELEPIISKTAKYMINALNAGNKIMFCGNGGSAADSQHLASELVGKYKLNRTGYNAIALTTDTSVITALSNDYGYETIFARQIESIGKKGDILFGLSTSGKSINIINALKKAKEMEIITVSMTGFCNNELSDIADISIKVPSDITNNIQEMHIVVGHLLCDLIEENIR